MTSPRPPRVRPRRRAGTLLAAALTAAVAAAPAHAQAPPGDLRCQGQIDAPPGPYPDGPRLRFGITPLEQAGQLGPVPAPAKPAEPGKRLAAVRTLAGGRTFVARINRVFWSDPDALVRAEALARQFAASGIATEFQLRYHPDARQEGDIQAWTAWVREAVRRLGPIRGAVGLQVTNEVNFPISEDSSDGAFARAREALVEGVIAARDEARRLGHRRLEVGFNWFYRLDPFSEIGFWRELAALGGERFAAAVQWVGLDAYPGTYFPPVEAPGGHRDGLANALSVLRDCYMPLAALGRKVPIHVEENGWPTSPPLRSHAEQAEVLETMVRAAHDLRAVHNVTDYRWFNLRDADSSSPNPQQQYGLMTDAYVPKPAFERYRALAAELGPPVRRRRPARPMG